MKLIEMVEKQNTLITINLGTYLFILGGGSFKVCNNACVMSSFWGGGISFINFMQYFLNE